MTQPSQPTPLHDVDQLVGDLLEVQDQIADLQARATHIKGQLADRVGTGNSAQVGEVTVAVREPNRKFVLERAWTMLTPEQQALCVSRDAALVKKQLPEVLLEQCYDAGTGGPIVTVR